MGAVKIELDADETVFESLTSAIVYQQLHGKAAATILGRVKTVCHPRGEFPTPAQLLAASDEALRGAGLSRSKLLALKDLAQRVTDGLVPTRAKAETMSDAALIEALTEVRGIGPWTAQMLLIFTLGRPDVLPVDDFGVRKGFAVVYGKKKMPTPKELALYGEQWRPFRSIAAWYLWRALELERFKGVKIEG